MGSKKRPFYRIIATDSRNARDGRFIETLGYYNPISDPPDISIKEDLVFKWMERGAVPSENTESLLRRMGVMKKWALLQKGVPVDQLDAKVDELRSKETSPMSAEERARKEEAAAAAKQQAEEKEAEAKAEAEKAEKAKTEAPAEPEAGAPAKAEAESTDEKSEPTAEKE
jgi:small subunit ribosomal protein S16